MFSNCNNLKATVISKGENVEHVIRHYDNRAVAPIVMIYWLSKDNMMYTTIIKKVIDSNSKASFAEDIARITYNEKFKQFLL